MAAANKPVFTYFGLRGLGEVSRLLMAEGKIAYEDNRVDFKDWPTKKATTPFGQMPLLQVGGVTIAQSGAIERYIAKQAKLYGSNDLEAAQIDMIVEGVNDARKDFFGVQFNKDENERNAKYAAYGKDQLARWCGQLTALLKANGGGNGYFVGNSATYADIHFYRFFDEIQAKYPNEFKAYPELSALIARVAARPAIAGWLKARPATPH
jgi:glutathione S-transferase